jgi:hypothetical protein
MKVKKKIFRKIINKNNKKRKIDSMKNYKMKENRILSNSL